MIPTLSIAETDDDIAACMALRWSVFVEEQGVPEADELDGTDTGSTMVIARSKGEIVGSARFHLFDDTVKISRVCVAATARGSGIGARLINYVCDLNSASIAQLEAQTDALDFYLGLGFQQIGRVFMDAGIPHQKMEKHLMSKAHQNS